MSSNDNRAGVMTDLGLRSVTEIPEKYQHIFSGYPCFNAIQSKLLDFILETDESLVVSAPTGSGKTVLFELAIIRLLMEAENDVYQGSEAKIVYMAPVKALVSEKYNDWVNKFSAIGVRCLEVTGDSDFMSLVTIRDYQLILTTPEKWDSMTRLWNKSDHLAIIQQVRLFLIDEVHLLNEERRGSTLEAVVSRMKTVQKTKDRSSAGGVRGLRFVAVSATIPNGEDLAVWLGTNDRPARFAKIGEDMRPVKLKKFVLGYRNDECKTSFAFDMSLSYHLKNVVLKYSNGKPTLVFCNSRKSVQTTSSILVKQAKFQMQGADRQILIDAANQISDVTLADLLKAGIGNHHAGMALNDRSLVEQLFRDGKLPVLVATSTLAMGVNLPAHLVVVKSTECYMQNGMKPYTDTQILQMIGRAGRPQFDTSAVAVIMTKMADKERFERLVSGTEPVESTLHKNLAELLNAEVVLRTVTDVAVAVDWISSTYFYVRASRCPQRYGLPVHLPLDAFHARLHDMCMIELNGLSRHKIIEMSGGYDVSPTEEGSLMARFYIRFDTMKQFMQMKSDESIEGLLQLLSKSGEFADVRVRVVEKRLLNSLNGTKKDGERIRFPIKEKIKSKEMKVNCLIQATLDGRQVYDNALSQEAKHILATASRLSRGLVVLVWNRGYFRSLLSALYLSKSLHCSMWENSTFVSRQLPGIGPALSTLLVMSGKTTFRSLLDANPRDLESILNRNPPFGNNLQKDVMSLPMYDLQIVELREENSVEVKLSITNRDTVEEFGDLEHKSALVVGVGGSFNILLHKENIRDQALILRGGEYSVKLPLASAVDFNEVEAHLISTSIVGLDVVTKLRLSKSPPSPTKQRQQNVQTCIDRYMKMKRNIPKEKSPKIRKVDKNEAKRQSNLSFNMDKFVCRANNKKSITELSTETESAQEMRTSPFSDNSSHEKSEYSVEEGSGAGGNEQKQTRSENSVKLSSGRSHRGLDTLSDIDSGYSSVQVRGNSDRSMTDIHREESKENHSFNSNSSVTSRDDNNTRQSKPEMDVVEQICSKYKGRNSLFKWTKRIPRFSQPKNEPARSDDQLEPTYEEKLVQGICDEVSNRMKAQKRLTPLGRKAVNLPPARNAQSTCGTTKITDYLDRSLRNFKSARSMFNDGTPKSTISEPVHGERGGGTLRMHERSEESQRMRESGRETSRMPFKNDYHQRTSLTSGSQSSRFSRNDFEEYNSSKSTRKPQECDIVAFDDKSYETSDDFMMNNYNTPTNPNHELFSLIEDSTSVGRSMSGELEMVSSNYKSYGASDDSMMSNNYKRPTYQEHNSSTNRADTHYMQSYSSTSKSETDMLRNDSIAGVSRPPRSNVQRPHSNEIVLEDSPVDISRISTPQVDGRQSQGNGGFRVPRALSSRIKMDEPIALTRMSRAQVDEEKSRDFSEFRVAKTQKQKDRESDFSIIDTNGRSKVEVIDISCSEESSDEMTASSVASDNKNMSDMKMLSSGLPDEIGKDCGDTYPVATPEEKNVENSEFVHEKIMTSTTQPAPRFVPEISMDLDDDQATTQIVENFGLRNTKFYPIFSKRLDTMLESSKSLLPETNNYSDEKLDNSPENLENKECEDTIGVENEDKLSQQSGLRNLEDSTADSKEIMNNTDAHFSQKQSGLRTLQDSDIGSQKILSSNNAQLSQPSGLKPVEDSAVDLHNILGNNSDTDGGIHVSSLNPKKNDIISNSNQDEIDSSSHQEHGVEAEQTDSATLPQNCSQPTSNGVQSQTKVEKKVFETTYYSKAKQSSQVVMGEVANYDDPLYSQSMDAVRDQPSHEQNLPRVDHSSFQQKPHPKTEGRNVNNWKPNKTTEISRTPEDMEVATYLHSKRVTEGVNYTDLPRYPKEFQVDPHQNKKIQNNGTASSLSRLSKKSAVYTRVNNNANMEKSNFRNAQVQNNEDYGMEKFNEESNYDRYERFGPKIQYHASDSLPSYTNETQMSRVSPKILPEKSQGSFDDNNQYHAENHWNEEKDDMKPWQTLSQESCLILDQIMDDFENGYLRTEGNQYEHKPKNVHEDARKVVNGADNTTRPAISANYSSNDNYRHESQPGHEFQQNNFKSDSPISCSESHDDEEFVTIDELLAQQHFSHEIPFVEPTTEAQPFGQRELDVYTGNNQVSSHAYSNSENIMSTPSSYQLKNVETIEKCQRYLKNQEETKNKYMENKSESLNYKEDIEDEDELLIWDDSRSRYFSCGEGETSKGDSIPKRGDPRMISSNISSLKRELIDHSSTAIQHRIPLANFNATNMSKLHVETYDPENLVISQEQFSPPILNSNNNSFEVSDNLLELGSSFSSQIKLEKPDSKLETSALKMLERCVTKSPIERFGGCRSQVIGGACGYQTSTMHQSLLKTSSHMHCACGSSDCMARYSNPVCTGRHDLTCACPPKQSCPCFATSHRHNYFADSAPPCTLTSSGCHGACANRCNDVIRTQQPMGCSCYSCSSRPQSQCCATSSQVKRCCCGDGGHSELGYGHSGVRDFISAGELQARSKPNLTTPSYLLSSSATPSTCGCSNCEKLSQSLSQNNF